MAEVASAVYPLRASGEYAGTKCPVKKCTNYARFVLVPMGVPGGAVSTCGQHMSVSTRTLQLLHERPVVVQEVPGNWGRDLVLVDGAIARLQG